MPATRSSVPSSLASTRASSLFPVPVGPYSSRFTPGFRSWNAASSSRRAIPNSSAKWEKSAGVRLGGGAAGRNSSMNDVFSSSRTGIIIGKRLSAVTRSSRSPWLVNWTMPLPTSRSFGRNAASTLCKGCAMAVAMMMAGSFAPSHGMGSNSACMSARSKVMRNCSTARSTSERPNISDAMSRFRGTGGRGSAGLRGFPLRWRTRALSPASRRSDSRSPADRLRLGRQPRFASTRRSNKPAREPTRCSLQSSPRSPPATRL